VTTVIPDTSASAGSHHDTSGLFGHPKGMTTLFFTEMWERFSYYGMRAILVLYMVAPVAKGGLGFNTPDATGIYGIYTMMVYMTSIPGGWIADKILGGRLSVLIGGIIIALGHFCLAVRELPFFYLGLTLIVIGTGLLKPNISTMLGGLYDKNDPRRDAGFSFFYMGINIGAALSPLVCGFLAQSEQFKSYLANAGIDANVSWHFGFAAAGVGMLLGLAQYIVHGKRLANVGGRPIAVKKEAAKSAGTESSLDPKSPTVKTSAEPLTADELKKLGAIAVLFSFQVLFWAIYEQGGSSLNLFADLLTRNQVFGFDFPSSWLQSAEAAFCILLAPTFAAIWIKLGDKQPSSPAKFTYGLLFLGLGIALMVPASIMAAQGKVSPMWLVVSYLLQVIGEMCLSPVGLSTVTKLAPARFASSTMGIWFLASAFGNLIAGKLAGFFNAESTSTLVILFGSMAAASILATAILAFLTPKVRKLMGNVH
jgi:proton-dependent oligopeptide transporter, POT family